MKLGSDLRRFVHEIIGPALRQGAGGGSGRGFSDQFAEFGGGDHAARKTQVLIGRVRIGTTGEGLGQGQRELTPRLDGSGFLVCETGVDFEHLGIAFGGA